MSNEASTVMAGQGEPEILPPVAWTPNAPDIAPPSLEHQQALAHALREAGPAFVLSDMMAPKLGRGQSAVRAAFGILTDLVPRMIDTQANTGEAAHELAVKFAIVPSVKFADLPAAQQAAWSRFASALIPPGAP